MNLWSQSDKRRKWMRMITRSVTRRSNRVWDSLRRTVYCCTSVSTPQMTKQRCLMRQTSNSISVTVEPCRDVQLKNFCNLRRLLKSSQTGGLVLFLKGTFPIAFARQAVNPSGEEAAVYWSAYWSSNFKNKTNFTAQHLLTPTFNGAVDAAVVSSFGHLEHPRPQKVLISAVGRRVTPTASRQEEGNAAAQQQRAAQLHCHSGGFKHCQSVSRSAKPTRPAFSVERRFTRCLALWLLYLKFPLRRLFIKLNDKKKKSLDQRVGSSVKSNSPGVSSERASR